MLSYLHTHSPPPTYTHLHQLPSQVHRTTAWQQVGSVEIRWSVEQVGRLAVCEWILLLLVQCQVGKTASSPCHRTVVSTSASQPATTTINRLQTRVALVTQVWLTCDNTYLNLNRRRTFPVFCSPLTRLNGNVSKWEITTEPCEQISTQSLQLCTFTLNNRGKISAGTSCQNEGWSCIRKCQYQQLCYYSVYIAEMILCTDAVH